MSDLRACILSAVDAVEAAREELGRLDGIAGDGDHGMTMATAARNIRARLEASSSADGPDLLRQVALAVGQVGGAIGPIYATAILKVAGVRADDGLTIATLADAAERAEAAIMDLGKAKPGDKTVLDALHPLVESLRTSASRGDDLIAAAAAAAVAARAGAASTADMIATIGRASRLGERSRGWPDPGATSFSIIVEALAEAFATDASSSG